MATVGTRHEKKPRPELRAGASRLSVSVTLGFPVHGATGTSQLPEVPYEDVTSTEPKRLLSNGSPPFRGIPPRRDPTLPIPRAARARWDRARMRPCERTCAYFIGSHPGRVNRFFAGARGAHAARVDGRRVPAMLAQPTRVQSERASRASTSRAPAQAARPVAAPRGVGRQRVSTGALRPRRGHSSRRRRPGRSASDMRRTRRRAC